MILLRLLWWEKDAAAASMVVILYCYCCIYDGDTMLLQYLFGAMMLLRLL